MRNIRTMRQLGFRVFVRPIFPTLQWVWVRVIGGAPIVEGPYERQPYHCGVLRPGVTLEEVITQLRSHGFFKNRVAYFDPGQGTSLRRLCDVYPDRQYHVRIFEDGEVRGHYEFTPEDHPIRHLRAEVYEERREDFHRFLSGLLQG